MKGRGHLPLSHPLSRITGLPSEASGPAKATHSSRSSGLRITHYSLRNLSPAGHSSRAHASLACPPKLPSQRRRVTRHSERAIALVVTLILLAVITFMAVTFLVVSTTDRGNVSTSTEQKVAADAVESGFQNAIAKLEAQMMAFSNSGIGLMVSTNYEPPGFITGNTSFTNVGYHYVNGAPVNQADLLVNLNHQLYLAQAPVFRTNVLLRTNESAFYVDINRNGRYETNGWQPVITANGSILMNGTNQVWENMVGDPEWVGILERGFFNPTRLNGTTVNQFGNRFPAPFAHSPSNHFTSRYAFIVIPTSASLDINNIHNYGKALNPLTMTPAADCYLRNQGVGSWELNLAAFLTDLNTNYWPYPQPNPTFGFAPYFYDPNIGTKNQGAAFDDALSLLRYRYAGKAGQAGSGVYPLNALFSPASVTLLENDGIDSYSAGPLTTGFWSAGERDQIRVTRNIGFPGSDNTNHFWDTQDFFDYNKTKYPGYPTINTNFIGFSDRLAMAGTNTDSYDRYSFFRFLSQMGIDSAPESPKLNLNYANVDATGKIVPDLATNFTPWDPAQFFTNAVVRLLTNTFTDSNPTNPLYITNYVVNGRLQIMIYPTNHYTPAVHHLLQLAANIYDASTTNRTLGAVFGTNMSASGFPTMFQPIIHDAASGSGRGGGAGGIFITGYREVTNQDLLTTGPSGVPLYDLNDPNLPNLRPLKDTWPTSPPYMLYGIPFVVGAKKGFPNFNEFGLLSDIRVSRTLRFHRALPNGPITQTNQVYNLGISNAFGVEAWNSYSNAYPHQLQIITRAEIICSTTIGTNSFAYCRDMNNLPVIGTNGWTTLVATNNWQPFRTLPSASSFIVPLSTNYLFLTNSDYSFNKNQFVYPGVPLNDLANSFPIPDWRVHLASRIRFILVDTSVSPGRIVDYVNLSSYQDPINVPFEMQKGATCDGSWSGQIADLFCTNRIGNPRKLPVADTPAVFSYGLNHQYLISLGTTTVDDNFWRKYNAQANDKDASIFEFRRRMMGVDLVQQDFAAPFSPTRTIHQNISWQANDPLVHYTIPDLTDLMGAKRQRTYDDDTTSDPFQDLGGRTPLNAHYRPWGGKPGVAADTTPPTKFNLSVKDPAVARSDDLQFVTNKFPDLGWIGRVHRGTPWQTVFLKSPSADTNASVTWAKWSGHILTNWYATNFTLNDYILTDPTNDYRVLDLFTTAINDNASRGQLSVNQSGMAAWSAVLAGCIVNTNTATNSFSFIQPAGTYNVFDTNSYPALARIVAGINRTRTNNAIMPTGRFERMGDILRTPELTVASPYIVTNSSSVVNDAVYERIPQQILSLLRGDDPARYVIFAFGQALKPAPNSVITTPGNFGLCTNYQITAESAARAVVHIEGAPNNPHVVIDSYNVLPPY